MPRRTFSWTATNLELGPEQHQAAHDLLRQLIDAAPPCECESCRSEREKAAQIASNQASDR